MLHRDRKELAGAIVGQSNNLLVEVPKDKLTSVILSEIVHLIYQGCSRGSCRIYNEEVTRPMKVWFHHHQKKQELQQLINRVMPNVKWDVWKPQFQQTLNQTDKITVKLEEVLKGINEKISASKVKKLAGLQGIPIRTFQIARDKFLKESQNWSFEGRSFIPL